MMTEGPGEEMDALVARRLGFNGPLFILLPYSTDIDSAWQVVRTLKTQDVFFELYSGPPDPLNRYDPEPIWTARFVRDGNLLGYGTASTPAEAICLAALKWTE